MQIDQDFETKVKAIQKKIMMKRGEKMSLREITKKISKYPEWETMEQKLLSNINKVEDRIKFDRRKKQ